MGLHRTIRPRYYFLLIGVALLPWVNGITMAGEPGKGYGERGSSCAGVGAQVGPTPINLPTVLELVHADNPTIALAQARVRQAYAKLDEAKVLWLPDLDGGAMYQHHDGPYQSSAGLINPVSFSNLYAGGFASMHFRLAEAIFQPLIARQTARAESFNAEAVSIHVQLDAVNAYFDVLYVNAALAINADILERSEQMLRHAKTADDAGLIKTKADLNRAQTEVSLRKQERFELQARAAAASARLAQLLLLPPALDLVPADPSVVPIILVPPSCSLDELIGLALQNRPEVGSAWAQVSAAQERLRQAKWDPLIPRVQIDYFAGTYGGGVGSDLSNFGPRDDANIGLYLELKNLGLGNTAQVREMRSVQDQASFHRLEVGAQVAAEVSEAAKVAGARFEALDSAQNAVKQALVMYQKLLDTSFGMIGPRPQYDALEPLLAIQELNQARLQYLTQVIEFDRAQFRLHAALGRPPLCTPSDPESVELSVSPLPGQHSVKSASGPNRASGTP